MYARTGITRARCGRRDRVAMRARPCRTASSRRACATGHLTRQAADGSAAASYLRAMGARFRTSAALPGVRNHRRRGRQFLFRLLEEDRIPRWLGLFGLWLAA